MKTGVVRRPDRRRVIAAKRIREIQHVRIKLGKRTPRTLKIEQHIMVAAAQQNRMMQGINPVQEVGMGLYIKNVLNLLQLGNTHKLQRFRLPFLRVAFDTR